MCMNVASMQDTRGTIPDRLRMLKIREYARGLARSAGVVDGRLCTIRPSGEGCNAKGHMPMGRRPYAYVAVRVSEALL